MLNTEQGMMNAEGRKGALNFIIRRSLFYIRYSFCFCRRSSGVERFLGKDEVAGSIPAVGSKKLTITRVPSCLL